MRVGYSEYLRSICLEDHRIFSIIRHQKHPLSIERSMLHEEIKSSTDREKYENEHDDLPHDSSRITMLQLLQDISPDSYSLAILNLFQNILPLLS